MFQIKMYFLSVYTFIESGDGFEVLRILSNLHSHSEMEQTKLTDICFYFVEMVV